MEYPPMRGGAGVYCEEVAHAAYESGLNLEVWVPKGCHSDSTVKRNVLPFKGSQDWVCSWRLKNFLQNQKLSEITMHIAEPGALRAMIRFGWSLPKPAKLIITLHGSEIPKFSRNPIERIFFRKFLSRADIIHVLSKYNEEKLLRFCPSIKNRILLIPGAPARDILPKSNPLENRDYSKKNIVLLCVGRIHPRKGQLELLKAIGKLNNQLKERLTCLFVGPQTKQEYAQKIIEISNQVGCDIQFLGDLNNKDLQEAYQNADIFALTSVQRADSVEGFGIVYLEASAHGLPILANRVGGVADAVVDGKTGLLCDPNKPDQLQENLKELIEQPEKRKTLGKVGIEWATKYSWKRMAKRLYKQA